MKLTPAQRDALMVLGRAKGQIGAWKRSTSEYPIPRINSRAAGSLVDMGLAKLHMPVYWSPYTHDYKYSITEEGKKVLSES